MARGLGILVLLSQQHFWLHTGAQELGHAPGQLVCVTLGGGCIAVYALLAPQHWDMHAGAQA